MAETVTPRQAVYAHLRADPAIVALVGSRVYHQIPPLGATFPLIVVNTISNVDVRDLAGVAYTETRLQVTVMAVPPHPGEEGIALRDAEAIAMAVRRSLEGFSGLMAGRLRVIGCRVDGYLPVYEAEIGQVHYHIDVVLLHKEG